MSHQIQIRFLYNIDSTELNRLSDFKCIIIKEGNSVFRAGCDAITDLLCSEGNRWDVASFECGDDPP